MDDGENVADDKLFSERTLEDVWLHSVHFGHKAADQGEAEADPLVPLWVCNHPGDTKQPWNQKMKGVALLTLQQKASLQSDDSDDELLPMAHEGTSCQMVQLLNTELQVVTDHESETAALSQIPLTFSDVVWAAVPGGGKCNNDPKFVVVLSPRPEEKDERSSDAGFLRKVWVLCVGNSYTQEGLADLLFSFASCGAVRWDLHQCYRISQRSLGEGGCGVVFLGQSIAQVGVAQVAVKITKASQKAEDEEASIRSETSILAEVRGHPNISMLLGIFCYYDEKKGSSSSWASASGSESQTGSKTDSLEQTGQLRWAIAMELCPQGDLFDLLSSNGALDAEAMMVLALSVFSALSHIHAHEVVHRDIKAENILLANGFRPVLADFGIAAHADDRESMVKKVGSPGYVAPEVLDGKRYGSKVDIFSAGSMLYFALCDTALFPGSNKDEVLARTIRCKVRFPTRVLNRHSAGVLQLIKSLLSREPMLRPTAIRAFSGAWNIATENTRDVPTVRAAARAMCRLEHIMAAKQDNARSKQRMPARKLSSLPENCPQQGATEPDSRCESTPAPAQSNSMRMSAASKAQESTALSPSEAMRQQKAESAQQQNSKLPESSQGTAVGKSASLVSSPGRSGSLASPGGTPSDRELPALISPVASPSSSSSGGLHSVSLTRSAPTAPLGRPMLVAPEESHADVSHAGRLGSNVSKSEEEREPVPKRSLVPRPPESATQRLSTRVGRVGRRILRPIERAFRMTSSQPAKILDKKELPMGDEDGEVKVIPPGPTLLQPRRTLELSKGPRSEQALS